MPEEIRGIFKPDAKNIVKIFSDADSYYQIPDYQRPYSWGDEQVEQLWDDLRSDIRKKYKELPWSDMAKMRDKIIHAYFGINYKIVWKAIKERFPEIRPIIQKS